MHGYGSKSMEQVNKCTGISLLLDYGVYPGDWIVHRLTPPRKVQGRLGAERPTHVQEDFHEKLIGAYAPFENADPELLSLFFLAPVEWNLAPPRRVLTIIIGRTGHAQAANHDKDAEWNVVWAVCRRTQLRMERKWLTFVTKLGFACAILGGMVNRQFSFRCLLQVIDLTTLQLGRNGLKWQKLKLDTNWQGFMSESRLRDGDERRIVRWSVSRPRWTSLDDFTHCDLWLAFLDDWHDSVMGLISQVASHHIGVKSTQPRRHWMTPEAWNDIVARQRGMQPIIVSNSRRPWGLTTTRRLGNIAASSLDILVDGSNLGLCPPEKALDSVEPATHKKSFSERQPRMLRHRVQPSLLSAKASSTWRSSLSEHFAVLPVLSKQALKMKSGSAHIWPANSPVHAVVLRPDVSHTARRWGPLSIGRRAFSWSARQVTSRVRSRRSRLRRWVIPNMPSGCREVRFDGAESSLTPEAKEATTWWWPLVGTAWTRAFRSAVRTTQHAAGDPHDVTFALMQSMRTPLDMLWRFCIRWLTCPCILCGPCFRSTKRQSDTHTLFLRFSCLFVSPFLGCGCIPRPGIRVCATYPPHCGVCVCKRGFPSLRNNSLHNVSFPPPSAPSATLLSPLPPTPLPWLKVPSGPSPFIILVVLFALRCLTSHAILSFLVGLQFFFLWVVASLIFETSSCQLKGALFALTTCALHLTLAQDLHIDLHRNLLSVFRIARRNQ